MEVVLKTPISLQFLTKLLILLYGTSNVIFINGNVMDIRMENIQMI